MSQLLERIVTLQEGAKLNNCEKVEEVLENKESGVVGVVAESAAKNGPLEDDPLKDMIDLTFDVEEKRDAKRGKFLLPHCIFVRFS